MSRSSTMAQSKQAERDVAELLHGRRLRAGEWRGPGDVDVVGPGWAAQVKHRTAVPAYITEGMRQVKEATASSPMAGILVVKTKPGRGRQSETFVVLDVETWLNVTGER